MKDDKLLKKLNELNSLSGEEAEEYLRLFIEDVQMDISVECDKTIGFGQQGKILEKLIKAKRKRDTLTAGLFESSKKGVYVLTGPDYCLAMRGTGGLPIRKGYESQADLVLQVLDKAEEVCTEWVPMPVRASLERMKRWWKAEPKATRAPECLFEIGENAPAVRADTLCDILGVIQTKNGYVNPNVGEKSALYLNHGLFRGLVFPYGVKEVL